MITYGQLFSILKLICFYYGTHARTHGTHGTARTHTRLSRVCASAHARAGVIMCMMDYFFIDCLAVLILSYVMTLSRPVDFLSTERPTSSLLGPRWAITI